MTNLTNDKPIIASPHQYFELHLRCLIRKHMPKEGMAEYERLIGGLFGYFRLPYGDKLNEAEMKVESLQRTVDFKEAGISRLENTILEQGKIIKESGLKDVMREIRDKIDQINFMAKT